MLDRLDLDTDKPSEEELAKRFGYEDDYYSGRLLWDIGLGWTANNSIVPGIIIISLTSPTHLRNCWLVDEAEAKDMEHF